VTISVLASGAEVRDVAMFLNTEPVAVSREGTAGRPTISSQRILAPGEYAVRVVVDDAFYGVQSSTWHFTVRHDDAIPAGFSQVDAKIQIVYPHDNAPVTQAELANVGAYLFTPGTNIPVPFDFDRPVRLWRALNNNPAAPVAVGTKVTRTVQGVTFPGWEFNDVDVSAARDPNNKLFFFVTVDGIGTNSNVWVHGADPRTIFPFQDVPSAVGGWTDSLDAKIEIVYPHDDAPVSQAQLANIGVDIFAHGTLQSVDASRHPFVMLVRSLNAEVATLEQGHAGLGYPVTADTGGVEHPRWAFNDADVAAANTPSNLILFRTVVNGATTFANVWAHGADVRTFFPVQDVPSRSAQETIPH
ncbi:MAG: hypothetical protein ACYC1C_02650, partial [Chloroflexota bacterium]